VSVRILNIFVRKSEPAHRSRILNNTTQNSETAHISLICTAGKTQRQSVLHFSHTNCQIHVWIWMPKAFSFDGLSLWVSNEAITHVDGTVAVSSRCALGTQHWKGSHCQQHHQVILPLDRPLFVQPAIFESRNLSGTQIADLGSGRPRCQICDRSGFVLRKM